MATHPNLGMETTAGTFALVGSRVRDGAPAINQVYHLSVWKSLSSSKVAKAI